MRRRICNLAREIRPWHGCAAILLTGLSVACFGQADPVATEPELPPRLLLLFDGRAIIGDISDVAGGYSVRRTEGSIVVPFEFVSLTATSLLDAYEKQRDNFQNPNAEQHLNLAQWCFRYRLREQAVLELEAALKLEPFRKEARELLQIIEAAESGAAPAAGDIAQSDHPVTQPGARTAAGISPENHLDFVRRVQPLLVNKCGNATCHGSVSTNGFRLHNVRTGRRHQRLHSDENLAMVLEFLDPDFPLHSPLLREPQDRESTVHRGVFAGALGEQQVELLRNWVQVAAVDRQLAHEYSGQPFSNDAAPVIQQAGLTEEPDTTPTGPRVTEFPRDSGDPRSSDLLRNVLDGERPDAFDPDEFNRRFNQPER